MAVPKKRTSKTRKRMRRSHDALRAPNMTHCPRCGAAKEPHRVCHGCGHYRGRQIFAVEKEEEV